MARVSDEKKLVFVPNGAIGWYNGRYYLHRSYRPFLAELLEYFDFVILSQLAVDVSENSFVDWHLDNRSNLRIVTLNLSVKHSNIVLRIFNYITAFLRAAPVVKKESFFYLCVPGHIPMIYAILCRVLGRKYALYVRGDWSKGMMRFGEKVYAHLFRHASFVLVTGHDYLSRITPLNIRTELVVPMIELCSDDLYIHRDFGLGHTINLLFLSRIERAKGILDLLDAFESLRKKDDRLHLVIAGDGPDFSQVQERCKARGLAESVTLTGLVDDREKIRELYMRSDIFILPSHHEGFPRVLYEAMCFGLPIITTFVGSIGSVMKHGRNCLKIQAGDKLDIELKVLNLIKDEELRQRIGRGAIETMATLFKGFDKSSHAKQVIEWTRHAEIY